MNGRPVRVLVRHRAPVDRPYAVEAAYFETADRLTEVPGLLRTELLAGAGTQVVLMDWRSADDYRAWEAEHRRLGHPSPLRPYQDRAHPGGHYEIYDLAAEHAASRPPVHEEH